jgi:hypothetical protein
LSSRPSKKQLAVDECTCCKCPLVVAVTMEPLTASREEAKVGPLHFPEIGG